MRHVPCVVETLVAAGFLMLLLRVLGVVLSNSAIEWPFEYREFAPVSFTGALIDGIDPYALENVPRFTNVYGPLYNLLVWPFAALAGNGFQVHRLVSLFLVGAGSALLCFLIRLGRGGGALALCAGSVFFLAQIDDVAGLARPDALGTVLFLAALAVLVRSPGAGPISLALSALLVDLAFFTKPYFGLAAPIGAAFLLLRRGPAALARYAAWGCGWFALLALAAHRLWPTCFIETLYLMSSYRDDYHSWTHLAEQLTIFARGNVGLLAVAVAAHRWRGARENPDAGGDSCAVTDDVRVLGLLGLGAGGAVLVLLLGTHTGNGQLYYSQLILPFLLLLAPLAARGSRAGRALALLAFVHALVIRHDFTMVKLGAAEWLAACPPCAAFRMTSPYQYGSPVFDAGEGNRRSLAMLRELIARAPGEVFGGPESSALLQEMQGRYYDNGLSEFCVFGIGGEAPLLRAYGERCRSHWEDIQRRMREQHFARAVLTLDSQYLPMLRGRYRMTALYPILLGYTRKELGVFEPISR